MKVPNLGLTAMTIAALAGSLAMTSCSQSNPTSEAVVQNAVDTLPLPKEALEAAWEKDIRAGEDSNKEGMYQDSEASFARALSRAEKLGEDDPRLERTLRGLCISYLGRSKFSEAEVVQRRLLAIYDKAGSKDEQKAANACLELGRALAEQKRFAEARSFYDRALSIYQKVRGDGHANTAWVMHELAALDEMEGKDALAEPLYLKSAKMHEAQAEKAGASAADEQFCLAMAAYQRLANCLINQGKLDEATPIVAKVKGMHDRHVKSLSKEQLETAALMESELELADLMQQVANHALGKNDKKAAEELLKDALAIDRKYYAANDLDLSVTINSLAELYLSNKEYKLAEPLLAEAYDIRKQVCDQNSWEVAELAEENARLMEGKKDVKQQREFEQAAFKLWPKTAFTNKSPWRDHLLKGTKAQQMEQWEQALSETNKAVDEARKFGADDLRLAESLMRMAGIYTKVSESDRAEKAMEEARAIRKKHPAFAKLDADAANAAEKADNG